MVRSSNAAVTGRNGPAAAGGAPEPAPSAPGSSSSSSQAQRTSATGASRVTRCPAWGKTWTWARGARRIRSSRNRSWKTGSRPPQASSTGQVVASKAAATPSSAAHDGSVGATGMSATNSATAWRRERLRYGARSAPRCSRPVIRAVPSTKTGVCSHTTPTAARAAAMSGGTFTPSGRATAVLVSTSARQSSRADAPMVTGPPQSWAAITMGPEVWASQKATSSSMRSASTRGVPRPEKPIPVWSTATTRQPAGAAASTSRQM